MLFTVAALTPSLAIAQATTVTAPTQRLPEPDRPRPGDSLAAVGADLLLLPRETETIPGDVVTRPSAAATVLGRSRPDFDAQGINLGGVTAFPEVAAVAGYDGNVFALSNGVSDAYGNIRGGVRLDSNWGRNALQAAASVNERTYAKYTSESGLTYRGAVNGRYDISRAGALSFSALHEHAFSDRRNTGETISTRRPVRYDLTTVMVGARQGFGHLIAQASLAVSRYDFQDAQSPAGVPLSEQYRDNTLYRAEGEVGYATGAGPVVFVSLARELRRFRLVSVPVVRDSNGVEALVGLSGQITPLINGRVAVGYIEGDFRTPLVRRRAAVSFQANIDYSITELTTISLSARRYFQNVASPTAPAGLASEADLAVNHELLRNLIVSGTLTYRSTRYLDTDNISKAKGADTGVRWLINRHLRATADVGYSDRNGTSVGNTSRKYHEVNASAGLAFAL